VSPPRLAGMTWNHPRGYDPMVACSALWREKTGVEVAWDKRSLQDFESFPVEELARRYDLIVIDHPHVGQVTAERCLTPLDVAGREDERTALAAGSVGRSYPSYLWQRRQWAFPIDAASQVQAFRPDLIEAAPRGWEEMLSLAHDGRVLVPLRTPHSLVLSARPDATGGRRMRRGRRHASLTLGSRNPYRRSMTRLASRYITPMTRPTPMTPGRSRCEAAW